MKCNKDFLIPDFRCPNDAVKDNKCLMHSGATIDSSHIRSMLPKLKYEYKGKIYLDFSDITFRKGVVFDKCLLPGHDFVFFDNCTFDECKFEKGRLENARFHHAEFHNIQFNRTRFCGDNISFTHAKFYPSQDRPIFNDCIFENLDKADFSQLKWYLEQTPFTNCCIDAREIIFRRAYFNSKVFSMKISCFKIEQEKVTVFDSDSTVFYMPEKIDFTQVKFRGNFEYLVDKDAEKHTPELIFAEVDFDNMNSAYFRRPNLKKAIFYYSKIEKVDFYNTVWPIKDKRKILYNEIDKLHTPLFKEVHELRRTYIQLKKNFEEKRDYDTASDWHYREMETRRRLISSKWAWLKWLKQKLSFITAYKYISCYGESYLRPLLLLFLFLSIGAIAYLFAGFEVITEMDKTTEYEWFVNGNIFPISEIFTDFLLALTYAIANAGFMRPETFKATSFGIDITNILLRICIAVFLPLFLLALRRRFKR